MIFHLFIGALIIFVTVMIHALALDRILKHAKDYMPFFVDRKHGLRKATLLSLIVLAVFVAHIIEIWIWALFFLGVDCPSIPNLETALYFSTSTFTTVGYGDIVLGEKWRLLSSFESANGFMLFGWSTAFIFEVTAQIYKAEAKSLEMKK